MKRIMLFAISLMAVLVFIVSPVYAADCSGTINYSSSIKFQVGQADNALIAYLNPDSGGNWAEVYDRVGGGFGAAYFTDTIDLKSTIDQLGGDSADLYVFALNFKGGGGINFGLIADGTEVCHTGSYVSNGAERWVVTLAKEPS